MPIKRYHGQPLPISVKYESNPLQMYGKLYSDIEDISMNFKQATNLDDDDLYLEKLQSTGGVILEEAENRFIMLLTKDDYLKLFPGEKYDLVLAVKVTGIDDYIELSLSDPVVEITKDKQRK